MVESIGIKLVDGALHIEGFPDAVKAIQLSSAKAKRLADLALHRSDLSFALQSLEALNSGTVSDHVRESLWRSAIVHLYKCFQDSASRSSLAAAAVYSSAPPEAMLNFVHFRHLRNKHLVHDENSYAQCLPAAILNDGTKDHKIERILASTVLAGTLGQDEYSNVHRLIDRAIDWVDRAFDALCAELTAELESIAYADLLVMPDLTVDTPKLEDLARPRKRP